MDGGVNMIGDLISYIKNSLKVKPSGSDLSGFPKMAEELGVQLRDLTYEEMQGVSFEKFGKILQQYGLLSESFNPTPASVEIDNLGKDESKVNAVNIKYVSLKDDKFRNINIRRLNVSYADNGSNIYRQNKKMSELWQNMCFSYLWAAKSMELRQQERENDTLSMEE